MSQNPAERGAQPAFMPAAQFDYERLRPHFKSVFLERNETLYQPREPIKEIYFPESCVLSAVMVMTDGDAIEVGTIGNEGAAGLTVFSTLPATSPHRVFAQISGNCLRIDTAVLEQEAARSQTLRDLLLRHNHALLMQISQSAACNGLHPLLKRCCRWLLMTHDRVEGNEVMLTHEFLSFMLGVRRPGVTEALQLLQEQGLIETAEAP